MVSGDRAVWSAKQGDTWKRSWTCAEPERTYDFTTLLVQLRNERTGALVATNEPDPADGVWAIDTNGSADNANTAGPVTLALSIDIPDGADFTAKYILEAQAAIDAATQTFLEHPFEVRRQWAVLS